MSEAIDQAIQDIAIKHGVLLSKDDPILLLHTMNERLLEENRKTQEKLLAEFKKEMQVISSQWQSAAKEKAERVLNAALASSKEVVAKLLQDSVKATIHDMKKLIFHDVAMPGNHMRNQNSVSWLLLLSSMAVTLICFYLLFIIL
jgi:hypothetical protein